MPRRPPIPPGNDAQIHQFPVTPMTPGPADDPDRPQRRKPYVLAIGNQKGGVGKTTVTLGLAEAAAAAGLDVVVIDFDPQANLTTALHPYADSVQTGDLPSIESCLIRGGRSLAEVLYPSLWQGVRIAGASDTLSGLEQYLINEENVSARASSSQAGATPRLRLRRQIHELDTDLVLIDLQRSLSVQGTAGLLAADGVIGVTEPSTFSDRGLADLAVTVSSLSAFLGPDETPPQILGIVVNMVARTRESERVLEGLTTRWQEKLWQPLIPQRAVIKEAYSGYRTQLRDFGGAEANAAAEMFDAHLDNARTALTNLAIDRHQ